MYALLTFLALVAVALASDNDTSLEDLQVQNIITNGYPAYEGKAPYIVSIRSGNNYNGRWVGAGVIISTNWVLTSRYVVNGADFVDIHYGSNWGWRGVHQHRVERTNFIVHENSRYDIALIRTPYIYFNSLVNRVTLPKLNQRYETYEDWWTVACGWGNQANGQLADWLQCIDVQVISNNECRRNFGGLVDQEMCTRVSGGRATCNGDSGGPLVTHNNGILVGIISFSLGSWCASGCPNTYTRVATHLEWIRARSGVVNY